ncbi:hypothetical protein [Silvanigrella aquatica]|nr:hypothetical protein [Silvanigrella aquatica]
MKLIRLIIILLLFLHVSMNAFSQSTLKRSSIDILFGGGPTTYYFDNGLNNSNKAANVFVLGLYSLSPSTVVSPIIGFGLNTTINFGSFDVPPSDSQLQIRNFIFLSSYFFGSLGLKFNPSPKISFYTLGNVGAAYQNNVSGKLYDGNNNYLGDFSYNINKHYYFGASLIAMFRISNNFSIGTDFIYNRHIINNSDLTYQNSSNSSTKVDQSGNNFHELSGDIVIRFNF